MRHAKFFRHTFNRRHLTYLLIFFIFYIINSSIYLHNHAQEEENSFKNHALILANDVWALDQLAVQSYLQLARNAEEFQSLLVTIPENQEFLSITGHLSGRLARIMQHFGLIWTREMHAKIMYNNLRIGTLQGKKYVTVIFPLLNILMLHILLALLTLLIDHQFQRRRFLEKEVATTSQSLVDSERRFQDLVELLPEMIFEFTSDGTIQYANQRACQKFALDPLHSSINIFNLMQPEDRDRAREVMNKRITNESLPLFEYTAIDKNGEKFPLLLKSAPITHQGTLKGMRAIGVDITERKQLEEKLRRDQKMKSIGLMAGGVAHDLNNILSGIVSYPDLILLDLPQDSPLREPLEEIRKAGFNAREVVADLLTVARGVVIEKEICSPNELIYEYLTSPEFKEQQKEADNITFTTSLCPNVHHINCSPIHFRKCLMNLTNNGIEAIPYEGTICITSSNIEIAEKETGKDYTLAPGNYVQITIEDTGPGIPAEIKEHIFEPFFSKKVMGKSGTGLGLAIVWNTMLDHGGAVKVHSTTSGSTFTLLFPSALCPIPQTKKQQELLPVEVSDRSILVIDDEPGQRQLATKILQTLGFKAYAVSSGDEAVQRLRKQPADLILLDMLLEHDQPNGKEVFRQIVTEFPAQRAVITSGFADHEDIVATLNMGASGFVPKPYTLNQIREAIYGALQLS
ncbi:PAS domain-containing sensor histidine kinase [Desulfogranum japonicum]|uniref:PAS domain-containing sensor histidine kinase n=1 Tax=Desulfogranum japonicum TaxID=231447 RepID=UPI0003F9BF18|nr:PAS domain-containing sensor histidine kinase [Desulfogranum japonicum]